MELKSAGKEGDREGASSVAHSLPQCFGIWERNNFVKRATVPGIVCKCGLQVKEYLVRITECFGSEQPGREKHDGLTGLCARWHLRGMLDLCCRLALCSDSLLIRVGGGQTSSVTF